MSDTPTPQETSDSGLLQSRLVRLITLARKVVETSDEPECGCEYQHERCAAMDYRNAVCELESFIKKIEPNAQRVAPATEAEARNQEDR